MKIDMESCKVSIGFNPDAQIISWLIQADHHSTSIPLKLKDVDRQHVDSLLNSEMVDVKFGSLWISRRPFSNPVRFQCPQMLIEVPAEACLQAFDDLDKLMHKLESVCVQIDTIGAEYEPKSRALEFSWYVDGSREVQTKRFVLEPESYQNDHLEDSLSFQIKGKRRADGDLEDIDFGTDEHTLTVKYGNAVLIFDRDRVEHALNDLVNDCLSRKST